MRRGGCATSDDLSLQVLSLPFMLGFLTAPPTTEFNHQPPTTDHRPHHTTPKQKKQLPLPQSMIGRAVRGLVGGMIFGGSNDGDRRKRARSSSRGSDEPHEGDENGAPPLSSTSGTLGDHRPQQGHHHQQEQQDQEQQPQQHTIDPPITGEDPLRKEVVVPLQSSMERQEPQYPFLVRCRNNRPVLLHNHPETVPEVHYEIVELTALNHAHMRIEYRQDHVCPFCGFRAAGLKKLQTHLPRFHRDHHDFTFTTTSTTTSTIGRTNDLLRIVALPTVAYLHAKTKETGSLPQGNLKRRGSFQFVRIRNPSCRSSSSRRRQRLRRSSDGLRQRRRRHQVTQGHPIEPLEPMPMVIGPRRVRLRDPWPIPSSVIKPPPIKTKCRQYYHFRTSQLPMRPGDSDFDSEDESDHEWLDEYAVGGINEFTDLEEDEKKFIFIWNRFFRRETWVLPANISFVDRLYSFLNENIDELVPLQQEIALKLLVLVDHRMISDDDLEELMAYFHYLVEMKKEPHLDNSDRKSPAKAPGRVSSTTNSSSVLERDEQTSALIQREEVRKVPLLGNNTTRTAGDTSSGALKTTSTTSTSSSTSSPASLGTGAQKHGNGGDLSVVKVTPNERHSSETASMMDTTVSSPSRDVDDTHLSEIE